VTVYYFNEQVSLVANAIFEVTNPGAWGRTATGIARKLTFLDYKETPEDIVRLSFSHSSISTSLVNV
jgi:hypothetical protein